MKVAEASTLIMEKVTKNVDFQNTENFLLTLSPAIYAAANQCRPCNKLAITGLITTSTILSNKQTTNERINKQCKKNEKRDK